MIAVAVAATAGMLIFGLEWLRTLRKLHEVQADRDQLWDRLHPASSMLTEWKGELRR